MLYRFLYSRGLEAWLKRMTKTMHGQGLKAASRDNFYRRFALGRQRKEGGCWRQMWVPR